ncbi:MAG: sugar ABC transporter permease [Anaerolineae bacterium]|nr:MAG: sugar ABC transporter permease [Anaerolineae bacterium]
MSALGAQVRTITRQRDKTHPRRINFGKWGTISLFVLPGMLLFVLFVLIPIAKAAQYSLYDWDGFGPLTEYVKFGNYDRLNDHKPFRSAINHSFFIMFLSLTVQLPLAMMLALLVGRGKLRGRKIFRMILFVPFVFSEIITALIWMYVFHPGEGLANVALGTLIPAFEGQTWLGDRDLVMYSLFAVLTWKYFGFYMILYMAGLQGVSKELEEAARVDGANELQVLRYVTLPLLGSTIRLTIYLSVLGSFQQFAIAWILTRGGSPANSSHLISTYLYKFGIKTFRLGYGSSVAVVLFTISLLFSLGYQRIVLRRDYAD